MKKLLGCLCALTITMGSVRAEYYNNNGDVVEEGGSGSSTAKGVFGGAAAGALVGGLAGGGRGAGYGALGGAVLGGLIGSSRKKTKVYSREQVQNWQRQKDQLYQEYQGLLNQAGALAQQADMKPYNITYNPGKYSDGTVKSLQKEIKALERENKKLHSYINKAQNKINKKTK